MREVITLGHVTPVPHAPAGALGVVNYRGAITTVLDVDVLLGGRGAGAPATAGESAILVEVNDLAAALRTTGVIEVATLRAREGRPDELVASSGLPVPLVDPPVLLELTQQNAIAAAAALPAKLAGRMSG